MGSPPPSTADPGAAPGGDDAAADARHESRRAVVRGTSMRPGIEGGDVITVVEAGAPAPVRPGEVVTFRDERGGAVTHRLLGCEPAAGGPVMITQGDGRTEPDAPWPADRLVGTVTAAERAPARRLRRMLALERLAWWEAGEWLATRLRSWRLVRRLQRRLVPTRLVLRTERRAGESGEWLAITCTACDAGGRAAGWQTVVRQAPDTDSRTLWLLFGLQVRLRYRGLGLSRRLLAAAEAGVAREGGGRMYAFVRPDNRPSLSLFRSSGWRDAAPPAGTVRVPELATCLCFVRDV